MGFYSPVDTFIIMLNKIALRALFAPISLWYQNSKAPVVFRGNFYAFFNLCILHG